MSRFNLFGLLLYICTSLFVLFLLRCEESAHAVWRLENIDSGHLIEGLIKAQFMVNEGPSTPGPTMVQFSCDDASLSQIDFELFGSGYKLSLLRNKISTGKYLCW